MKKLTFLTMLFPAVLSICYVTYRIFAVPENHIGFSPYAILLTALPALIAATLSRGYLRYLALLIVVLNISIVCFSVQFGLLMQYEDWIKNGMPENSIYNLSYRQTQMAFT